MLAQARLYPDMFPLARQVQIACDTAKGAAARLAGIEIPKHEDNEVNLADLKYRDREDPGFLEERVRREARRRRDPRDRNQGAESARSISPVSSYLNNFVLPNFFFHETMTYALLRHNGVEVGKGDFLGAM